MTEPPDPKETSIFSMSPNPIGSEEQRKTTREEEARRQRAIKAHAKRAATKLPGNLRDFIEFPEKPTDVELLAKPSTLANLVESKATPKMIEVTRVHAGKTRYEAVTLPDGSTAKGVEVIGEAVTKFQFDLGQLGQLIASISGLVEDIRGFVQVCIKIISSGVVAVYRGDEAVLEDAENDLSDSSDFDESAMPDDYWEGKDNLPN